MLGSGPLAETDEAGRIVMPGGWTCGWWVGAEDRWHVPASSTTLRQRLIEEMPVVATSIRVPGGDVESRAFGATAGGDHFIVTEIQNGTPTPVAAGFVIDAPGRRVDLDGALVRIDGRAAVRFAAPPRSYFLGEPYSLFVLALSHTSVARVSIGCGAAPPDHAGLPSAARVAGGWVALAERGASVVLPDATAAAELSTARAFLALHAAGLTGAGRHADRRRAAAVADALTLLGLDDEAGAVRLATRVRPARTGLALVRAIDADAGDETGTDRAPTTASGAAAVVRSLYRRLVNARADGLALLDGFDLAANRDPIEVNDLPVAGGTLGFAVRWHGERAALLWELDTKRPVRLSAPTLDDAWSSDEVRGEVLLGSLTSRS